MGCDLFLEIEVLVFLSIFFFFLNIIGQARSRSISTTNEIISISNFSLQFLIIYRKDIKINLFIIFVNAISYLLFHIELFNF